MKAAAGQIAERVRGTLVGAGTRVVEEVVIDHRLLTGRGGLFAAFRGSRVDGHALLAAAAAAGAVAALVDRTWFAAQAPGARFPLDLIVVDDVGQALWRLAEAHRRAFCLPVVAVTGSAGKTTTKNMLAAMLETLLGPGCVTPGNMNNLLGVPLTLLALEPSHRFLLAELGTNACGEIARLSALVRPGIGVLTGAMRAHLEGLGSVAGVAREKADLARALPADGTAVLPGDDARLLAECAGIAAKVVTFGQQETDLVRIEEATEGDRASGVLACRGERLAVRLPVCGTVNLRNAAAALCVACVLGLPVREAAAALARFVPDRMRMDMRTVAGATVLLDAYNANPESMLAALRTLAGLPGGRRIAVLGRMLELGADAPRLHEEVGAAAARLGVEVVVALMDDTGGYAAGAGRGGCPRVVSAGSHREAAEVLAAELKAGDLVLLKGSRGARVECVLDSLAEVTAP